MSENNKDFIEKVLKNGEEDVAFEAIPDENDSPLAEPVIQKTNPSGETKTTKKEESGPQDTGENKEETASQEGAKTGSEAKPGEEEKPEPEKEEETDAPEQEVDGDPEEEGEAGAKEPGQEGEEFIVPLSQAKLMADTIIGVANNVIEVGGGYFITISKHKDFYDFEEVIQIIDEQNVKNIKRLKLDEEDKALLRPLLIQVLRKKSKVLSPEQQLLGVALSIIIKKAKIVIEIREENEILVDRIRDVIRKELGRHQENAAKRNEPADQSTANNKQEDDITDAEEVVQEKRTPRYTGMPDSVLETAD